MTRNKVYDSLKFYAAFFIFITHFFGEFTPEVIKFWDEYPTKVILYGVTGKFATALFGLILGYFAYAAGVKRKQSIARYSLRRYVYFFVCGLFINFVYTIYDSITVGNSAMSYVYAIKEAVFVNASIYETFWCMKDFLIASIICFVLGCAKTSLKDNVIIVVLLCISHPWIGICAMGTLIEYLLEYEFFKKPWVKWLMLLAFFIFIKRRESTITYIVQGFCSLLFILLANNSVHLNKLLNNSVTAKLGEYCMTVFLIHKIVYYVVATNLYGVMFPENRNIESVIILLISTLIIYTVGYPINKALQLISNKIGEIIERRWSLA